MRSVFRAVVCLSLLVPLAVLGAAAPSAPAVWVGVWGAPPAYPTGPAVDNQWVRQRIRLSLGGQAVRIRLSNELGVNPLVIGGAHLALPGHGPGSIDPDTDHVMTFGGARSVTLEPGMLVMSDPIALETGALQEVAVSLFIARYSGPTATHPLGVATAFISQSGSGDGAAPTFKEATTSAARFFISAVEVRRAAADAVVAFGDSITDGYGSTPDENRRWPDVLAERIAHSRRSIAVVDAGISGNRILHDLPHAEYGPSALSRFDRDVLAVPRVRTVVLLESINDIGIPGSSGSPEQSVTAQQIIAGMSQLIERAHAHGLRVIGATLTPFADSTYPGYYDAEGEAKRQIVNRWIREAHGFDGVVDFDLALRDPARPDHLAPQFDCGDHLHPNDAGYHRMAESVNLDLL